MQEIGGQTQEEMYDVLRVDLTVLGGWKNGKQAVEAEGNGEHLLCHRAFPGPDRIK